MTSSAPVEEGEVLESENPLEFGVILDPRSRDLFEHELLIGHPWGFDTMGRSVVSTEATYYGVDVFLGSPFGFSIPVFWRRVGGDEDNLVDEGCRSSFALDAAWVNIADVLDLTAACTFPVEVIPDDDGLVR